MFRNAAPARSCSRKIEIPRARTQSALRHVGQSRKRDTSNPHDNARTRIDEAQYRKQVVPRERNAPGGARVSGAREDSSRPAYDRRGVNMRMAEPEVLAKARIRPFDGAGTWKLLDEA